MTVFLHGSRMTFDVGDYLVPAYALGLPMRVKTPNQPHYSPLFVYLTEIERYARLFGEVYEAEPVGRATRDGDAKDAWRCRRAVVVGLRGVDMSGHTWT